MLKNKILIKVTGSIAAYKTAYLISKLVQNGFEVKVVATQAALKFVGEATFEGLTGNKVYQDTFEVGEMMGHINLNKWAEIVLVMPADANTINKFANGIADNLITSLFLAKDKNKPYLIAPAMNVAMFEHPATKESLEKLKKWGIIVLPTEKGYLACGDFGYGKLLDPDLIYLHLLREMKKGNSKKRILITSGATIEKIDQIRSVSNISTGKTAIAIADVLYENGFDVRLLSCANSAKSNYSIPNYSFSSANDLKNEISSILKKDNYNLVIHLAAVSDYSPKTIKIGEKEANLPFDGKLDSSIDEFSIKFERNEKIVKQIKGMAKNKIKLVSFKFLDKQNSKRKSSEIEKLLNEGNSDFVVYNSLDNRKNNTQYGFQIFSKTHQFEIVENATELANQIITIIEKKL